MRDDVCLRRSNVKNVGSCKELQVNLYLVRHGEAKSKHQDPDRHLSQKGARDVEKMAVFLRPLRLRLDRVWHSGKPRAAQTADILIPALSASHGPAQREGLTPDDPVQPLKKELDRTAVDSMIVGHLPLLGKLASVLLGGNESSEVVNFQEAGVVCLGRREDGVWNVRWMMIPDLLPS